MEFSVTKRNATIQNAFIGDGVYDLTLPIGQLEDLQDLTDSGPVAILVRLQTGTWKVKDVRETIRLGLIGAGTNPQKAFALVNSYLISGYLAEYVALAKVVLQVAILGPEDDPVGESPAVPVEEPQTTEKSSGPESTPSVARRASRRKKSAE